MQHLDREFNFEPAGDSHIFRQDGFRQSWNVVKDISAEAFLAVLVLLALNLQESEQIGHRQLLTG